MLVSALGPVNPPVLHGMPSILSNAAHENCPGIPEIFEQSGLCKVTDDTLKALGNDDAQRFQCVIGDEAAGHLMSLTPNGWDDQLMVIDGHSIDSRITIWARKGYFGISQDENGELKSTRILKIMDPRPLG